MYAGKYEDFSYVNLTSLYKNPQVGLVVQSTIISLLLVYQLLMVLHLLNLTPASFMLVVLVHISRLLSILNIIVFNAIASIWFRTPNFTPNNITTPLLVAGFTVYLVMASIFQKLYYSPFTRNNSSAQLTTDYQVWTLWTNLVMVFLLGYFGTTLPSVTSITIMIAAKLYYVRGWSPSTSTFAMRVSDYSTLLTCVLIILNQISSGLDCSLFYMWTGLMLVLFAKMVLEWARGKRNYVMDLHDCTDASNQNILEICQECLSYDKRSCTSSKDTQKCVEFLCIHFNRCRLKSCYFNRQKPEARKTNTELLEGNPLLVKTCFRGFLLDLMKQRLNRSKEITIQYLVFCYETEQWAKIKKNRVVSQSISYDYVKSIVDERIQERDQTQEVNITEEAYQFLRKQFFDKFGEVLTSFKHFFKQLRIKRPSIDALNLYGHAAFLQVDTLRKLFLRLLNSDHFDLRVIEVYMEFTINFLRGESELSQHVFRISKQKWLLTRPNLDFLDSSVPTLQVDLDQDKILGINAESIKILKFHKIDMYDKKIQSLIHPYDSQETLRQFFDKINSKAKVCFLRDSTGQMNPINIKGRVKYAERRSSYLVQMEPLNRLREEGYILVTDRGQFIQAHPSMMYDKQGQIELESLFLGSICPQYLQLQSSKFLSLQFNGRDVYLMLCQTTSQNHSLINVKFRKKSLDSEGNQFRVRTSKQSEEKFMFCPVVNLGLRQIQMAGRYLESQATYEDSFQELDPTQLKDNEAEIKINFASGIKSYRLDGEIIYNIQLEHKTDADALDTGHHFNNEAFENQDYRKYKIKFYYVILILLAITYLVSHIYTIVVKVGVLDWLVTQNSLETILTFEHRFQRLFGIMRDAYLNITYVTNTTWVGQISGSLRVLRSNENTMKFSKTLLNMTMLNQTYYTFLDQLCNVFITNIYQLTISENLSDFQQLNIKSISNIDPALGREKQLLMVQSNQQLDTYLKSSIVILVIHVVITFAMLFMVALLNTHYKKQKQGIYRPWRMLTEEELHSIVARITMYEVLLQFSQRVEDVEVFGTLRDSRCYGTRDFPKALCRNRDKRKTYWTLCILVFLCAGVAIHGYSVAAASSQVTDVKNCIEMNLGFSNSYIQVVRMSKYDSQINTTSLLWVSSMLTRLGVLAHRMNYDSKMLAAINRVFYGDYCKYVLAIAKIQTCSNYAQGFLYPNPFQMGYLTYLSGMVFALTNNKTNSYPCSGIIGSVFSANMDVFIRSLLRYKISRIQIYRNDELFYFMTNLTLCFLTWLIIILMWTTSVQEIRKIDQIKKLIAITSSDAIESPLGEYFPVLQSETLVPEMKQS